MNWTSVLGATIALGCLGACAGYDGTEARYDSAAADVAVAPVAPASAVVGATPETDVDDAAVVPETDPEQYRISVEIPVDDVTVARGENLDVDALLDERTSFTAADFHLREVILVARSRRGGSAELIVDEWASGAVDIPDGAADSWYEVRIPAPDVDEGGTDWVVDFSGALDLNLLVVVLEPRAGMLAAATATVREVVVGDDVAVDAAAAVEVAPAEVVQAVEVIEPGSEVQTVINEVTVERPVYRTTTVYRYVDRPIHRYRVSWVYDPVRYYVFRDYYGWTYRYFPGTWDWRCYDLSFRLPRHHHHRDRHRSRADRHDGRRFDRRDGRRGDGDRRRDDRDRGDRRDRDRRGDRRDVSEARAVVSRPSALRRRVDPAHPRVHIASQREAERRARDLSPTRERPANPRLRVQRRDEQSSNVARVGDRRTRQGTTNPRLNPFQRRDSGVAARPSGTVSSRPDSEGDGRRNATNNPTVTVSNVRPRSFERREVQQPDRRATPTAPRQRPTQYRPPASTRAVTSERHQDHSPDPGIRSYQRRPEQREPTPTVSPRLRTARPPQPVANGNARVRQESRQSNARTRTFQRETDRRTVGRSGPRPAEPGRTPTSRNSASSNGDQRRVVDVDRGNARTRTFQRLAPRMVEPTRPRTQPTRTQSPPRASAPGRSTPTRQSSAQTRPQRAAPTRNTSRPAPQRERPAQRQPAQPKSDSASAPRPDEGRRGNARTRAFERR